MAVLLQLLNANSLQNSFWEHGQTQHLNFPRISLTGDEEEKVAKGSLWLCCQMAVLSYCRVLRVQLTEVQASSSSVGTIMLVYPSFSLGILFPEEIKLLSFLVCFKISLFDACFCDTLAISTSAV